MTLLTREKNKMKGSPLEENHNDTQEKGGKKGQKTFHEQLHTLISFYLGPIYRIAFSAYLAKNPKDNDTFVFIFFFIAE